MAVPIAPAAGEPIAEAWGDVVHDAVVAQDIQAGSLSIPSTASLYTDGVFVFPRPFAAVPFVQVTLVLGTTQFLVGVASVSATQVNCRLFRRDGANMAAGTTATVHVIAYGPRA